MCESGHFACHMLQRMQVSQGWGQFSNCPVLYLPGLCKFLKNLCVIKDITGLLCIDCHGRNQNDLILKNVKDTPFLIN